MPTIPNYKEQPLIDSFHQIAKQAFFPLDVHIRIMDWVRTQKRPYGIEIRVIPNQEDGQLSTKEKEALLAVARTWRETNFPGKTTEEVDALGIFVTVNYNPVNIRK